MVFLLLSFLVLLQLEQEILDFSEGLRVVGIEPYEKVALFADNSCRWLIADQGTYSLSLIFPSTSMLYSLLFYV